MDDPDTSSKLSEADQNTIKSITTSTLAWLEQFPNAPEEDIANKQKEVEHLCKPITMRFYTNASGYAHGPLGRDFPGANDEGPIIEDTD